MTSRFASSFLVLAALFLGSRPAIAGGVQVSPAELTLQDHRDTAVFTVTNDTAEPRRYDLSAREWSLGELPGAPTDAVVVSPASVSLKPGESRRVKVTGAAAVKLESVKVEVEAAYELVIAESPLAPGGPAAVAATSTSVPVFLAPRADAVVSTTLSDLDLFDGRLAFSVENDGNRHLLVHGALVTGTDGNGDEVFKMGSLGGYVLAGASEAYAFDIPLDDCMGVSSLSVKTVTDEGTWERTYPVSFEQCAPLAVLLGNARQVAVSR